MRHITTAFVTRIYRDELNGPQERRLLADLSKSANLIRAGDLAGEAWCRANGYPGYTSYASLDDLTSRDPAFGDLEQLLDRHAAAFARDLELDLGKRPLQLDSIWINVLAPGGYHTAHIHPHSVISGTLYLAVPKGAGAIKFEDPRHAHMMAAPPRKTRASAEARSFLSIEPKPGTLLLWESFLRHEVPVNHAPSERVSVSFNYRWG